MMYIQEISRIFVFWAPVLLSCAAEREYFLQTQNATWAQARQRCQVCFKELVSVTPLNIQTVVQLLNLTSDSWIGLRKNLNASDSGLTMPWSHWANGDPLIFQNWYPGRPKSKPLNLTSIFTRTPDPPCTCCCRSDIANVTNVTDITNSTNQTIITMATVPTIAPTTGSTMLFSRVSNSTSDEDEEDADRYIEDPCVAMRNFGAWFEKDCMKQLPFICYEDRFYGNATVTDVTYNSATLSWLAGPGNIDSYRVEVNGRALPGNLLDLTRNLDGLTPGELYSVKVFAIKCVRDLNPQTVSFYTKPGTVQNLIVTMVTESSVFLNWTRPAGRVDRYRVRVSGRPADLSTTTESVEVTDLMPGGLHTFEVIAGVQDNSIWGEVVSTQAYTKPGKVSRLTTSEHKDVSLLLKWEKPEGNLTGYRVMALNNTNDILFHETVNSTALSQSVTGLPVGTQLHLSVTALANGSLAGDTVTVVSYTAPAPVSNLNLLPTSTSINVSWDAPEGERDHFVVEYQLRGSSQTSHKESPTSPVNLSGLKSGANYTVTVYAVSGNFSSPRVSDFNFTLPVMPRNLSVTSSSKNHITLRWDPPENGDDVQYLVRVSAPFWGTSWSETASETSITFSDLNAGTKYDFKVQTVAGGRESTAVQITGKTDAEKKEVTLSMLCASAKSLQCEEQSIRESMFNELKKHFDSLLKDDVIWELKWKSL